MRRGRRTPEAPARRRGGGAARYAARLSALALALVATVAVGVSVQAQLMPRPDAPREPGLTAQLARGQATYAFSCTTCHGATGSGFAEARSAFPDDHYHCTRCHVPGNPAVMTQAQIDQTQSVFSLGDAPPLNDPDALARYGNGLGLYSYVRATMPRWDPGRLSDDAYLDVTVFVLHLAGVLSDEAELTLEALAQLSLLPPSSD